MASILQFGSVPPMTHVGLGQHVSLHFGPSYSPPQTRPSPPFSFPRHSLSFSWKSASQNQSGGKMPSKPLPPAPQAGKEARNNTSAPRGGCGSLCEFEHVLDLNPFVSDPNEGHLNYILFGILVHAGWSTHCGHCYCFVGTSTGIWHSLDDYQRLLREIILLRPDVKINEKALLEKTPVSKDETAKIEKAEKSTKES